MVAVVVDVVAVVTVVAVVVNVVGRDTAYWKDLIVLKDTTTQVLLVADREQDCHIYKVSFEYL